MIDERKTAKRQTQSFNLSLKIESISLNGEVKSKLKQVAVNTRRIGNKRKQKDVKSGKKKDNQYVILVLVSQLRKMIL